VDHRADFYSLGSVLYQLLKGKPLFGEHVSGPSMSAEDILEIAAAHRLQQPFGPTAGREPLLDELVLRLLEKNPDMRYQTGFIHLRALTNFQAKGLIHDLKQISTRDFFIIGSLKIGEVDRAASFTFPDRIY